MAVHLLRLPTEPAAWASCVAIGEAHLIPEWPKSDRFALVMVIRSEGPPNEADTRAVWITEAHEMGIILNLINRHQMLWFTVARYQITPDMIEQTSTAEEPLI